MKKKKKTVRRNQKVTYGLFEGRLIPRGCVHWTRYRASIQGSKAAMEICLAAVGPGIESTLAVRPVGQPQPQED